MARVVDLGTVEYGACHDLQNRLLDKVAAGEEPSTLLYVEHPPVFSLGAAFQESNLLHPLAFYASRGIAVEPTDRGGDVTFHGPKQLVGYPIFDLGTLGKDLHKWLRGLEEAVILAMAQFGLKGYRFPPHTGVWIQGRKVCAIGIKVRRWVSKHGIALNCDNDLSPFDLIVPCGIRGWGVTSLTRELGRPVTANDVKPELTKAMGQVFGLEFVPESRDPFLDRLQLQRWP